MSVEVLARRLDRLLRDTTPRILAVDGDWGVGKTFQWERALRRQLEAPSGQPLRYTYVSLFGLRDLSEVRKRITEEWIARVSLPSGSTTIDVVERRAWELKPLQMLKLLPALPLISKLESLAHELSFALVRNAVVVFDDLERSRIEASDLLGLALMLKEQRQCRVLLLANLSQLGADHKVGLARDQEKVIDEFVHLKPTPEESCTLAIGDRPSERLRQLKAQLVKLGLSNIRLASRFFALGREVESALGPVREEVVGQAMASLALFGVAYFEASNNVPPFCFLCELTEEKLIELQIADRRANEGSEDEAQSSKWLRFLHDYGYGFTDSLNLEIALSIKRGSVDAEKLRAASAHTASLFDYSERKQIISRAWDIYLQTFADNTADVIDAFEKMADRAMGVAGFNELNSAYQILEELGRSDIARRALANYIAGHRADKKAFDTADYPFSIDWSSGVKQALDSELQRFKVEKSLEEALDDIGLDSGWTSSDAKIVAEAAPDALAQLLRSSAGEQLRRRMRTLRSFSRFAGEGDHKTIHNNYLAALEQIGKDSNLNAIRVRGILPKKAGNPPEGAPPG